MHLPPFAGRWLRKPGRLALFFGLGALSASVVNADAGVIRAGRVPQQSAKSFGDLSIWSEGGRIWIAEPGMAAEELPLGDTPEARRLRLLLEEAGATAQSPRALRDRIILVGGGGEGFHWQPVPPRKGRDGAHSAAVSAASAGAAGRAAGDTKK